MGLDLLLREEHIKLNLKAKNKREAIEELASLLGDSKHMLNFNKFVSEVIELFGKG